MWKFIPTMAIFNKKIEIESRKQFELIDITDHVNEAISQSKIANGMVLVYNPHTTASVRLNHKEPLLEQDIMKMLYRLVPLEENYSHDLFEMRDQVDSNERSNGHAHVAAFLLGSSEIVPIENSQLMKGEKQSLFFVECDGPRPRDFFITIYGE